MGITKSRFRNRVIKYFVILILCAVIGYMLAAIVNSRQIIEEMTTEYTEHMISSINVEIDSYILNMSQYAKILSENSDVRTYLFAEGQKGRRFQSEQRVREQISILKRARVDIVDIGIVSKEGRYFINTSGNNMNKGVKIEDYDWLTKAFNGERNVTPSHVQNIVKDQYPWVVTLSEPIPNLTDDKNPGAVFIDLNFSTISNLSERMYLGEKGYMFIVSSDGTIVYHPKQQLIYGGFITEEIEKVISSTDRTFYSDDGTRLYIKGYSDITGWTTVGVFYQEEMLKRVRDIVRQYIIIALILMIVATFSAIMLANAVTLPILKLRKSMSQVQNGDFNVHLEELKSNDEIGDLVASFETMTGEINHLLENNVKTEQEKRKNEMKALQAQINPHFLYNTLDSIIWMSQAGKKDDVIKMTSSLSKLLRRSISNPEEMVTLAEEIDQVKNYLVIQKMRYRDKLEYEINSDPELEKHMVIKLLLQPLVENAIYHGIKYKEGKGLITIREYIEDGKLCIAVQDDGVGMTPDELEHIFDEHKNNTISTGVGVYNVDKRIKLNYGEDYGVYYRSWQGMGTVAILMLPLNEEGLERE